MTEPAREVEDAVRHVDARWDAARTERTLRGLPARRRRRQLRAGLLGAAGVAGVVAALVLGLPRSDEAMGGRDASQVAAAPAPAPAPIAAEAPRMLHLPDGSEVALLDTAARIATERATASLVALRLDAGRARFDVVPDPQRVFRVRSGAVTVEVLGTAFTLARRGEQTRVAVERGAVAVRWGDERRKLVAGESGWFPPTPAEAERAASDTGDAPRAKTDAPAESASAHGWREHAQQGEFKRAYQLLQRPGAAVAQDVAELMLAADAARLSGHPAAAVPYLRRVIDEHSRDARAPLAAFTLGGVLMNQLGLPREAEQAYATARRGTQSAALAQDALARQVEAASRAGDEVLARRLAEQYVREYPRGRRLAAVRRFGGL